MKNVILIYIIKFIFDVLCVNKRLIKIIKINFVVDIMVFESNVFVNCIELFLFIGKIVLKLKS